MVSCCFSCATYTRFYLVFFFFKQKTAYEMRISDWSSDVCSSDLVDPGYYFVTSAPQIVRGRIILGGWVTDGQFVGEPSGVVRAFDAVSGRLSWAFDIGHPHRRVAPPAGESYTPGSPNSWAPVIADDDKIGSAPGRERECRYGRTSE